MQINKIYIDSINKWCLVIEGVEEKKKKNQIIKKYIAIPPTSGDRVDIINLSNRDIFKQKYFYNFNGIIIIIKNGKIGNLKLT